MKENNTEKIASILEMNGGHIHLVGICGIGMAGLAFLLKSRGFNVTGCDAACNNLTGWLERHKIKVFSEHDPAHIDDDVVLVVNTSAVGENNPEIVKARDAGVCVASRGATLAGLTEKFFSICVCGTHGKTTTTAILAQGMNHVGRPAWFAVGAECAGLSGVAGGSGETMVVEADESDKTLVYYHPDIAVITNIEYDHAESFGDFGELKNCFKQLAGNTRGKIIYCADDPGAASVCGGFPEAVGYGFSDKADVKMSSLEETPDSLSFELSGMEMDAISVSLPVSGRHNALNAAAAVIAAGCAGISPQRFAEALSGFIPARRRFEKIIDTSDLLVVSDYAHHPSEIVTVIDAAKKQKRSRLVAVFQPHRFTRTRAFAGEFPGSFDGIDMLVLLPVYPASEPSLSGGTSLDVYELFRKHGKYKIIYASSIAGAWRCLKRILRKDDALLIVGAGDIENISQLARHEMFENGVLTADFPTGLSKKADEPRLPDSEIRHNEPLASKTTLRVGGIADIFIIVGSLSDLRKTLEWCYKNKIQAKALGAGSNVLVSDAGTCCVVRQEKSAFGGIKIEGKTIVAGCATGLNELVDFCVSNGLGGFEFLYGIPGTIGGALRMNAGAFGGAIGDRVRWVEFVDQRGEQGLYRKDELDFGYRTTPALEHVIVTKVGFSASLSRNYYKKQENNLLLTTRSPSPSGRGLGVRVGEAINFEPQPCSVIEAFIKDIRDKRDWMRGLRCAGSIFKNPSGQHAGQLLEDAGAKLLKIGEASVSERHANVIVTSPGATASDVLALIHKMRETVKTRFGVDLVSEVVCFE